MNMNQTISLRIVNNHLIMYCWNHLKLEIKIVINVERQSPFLEILFFSVTIKNKEWKVVGELPISDYARTMLDLTGEVKHFGNLLTHCKVFLKTIS